MLHHRRAMSRAGHPLARWKREGKEKSQEENPFEERIWRLAVEFDRAPKIPNEAKLSR